MVTRYLTLPVKLLMALVFATILQNANATAIACLARSSGEGYKSRALAIAAPAISSFSPVSGAVGTLVTINGTGLSSPTSVTIGGKTAIVISNTGAVLVAMVMPGAVTGAVSVTASGGSGSAGGNFTVTPIKYPAVQQGEKLLANNTTGFSGQGWSVATSADGNTALVGGFVDNDGVGATWVYNRSGGAWSQQAKLLGSGADMSQQGTSVALSADGNTAITGGANDASGAGAVWIFTRNNGVWTQQGAKLLGTGTDDNKARQGTSVSISADGNTFIVGGPQDGNTGAAWIFSRSNGAWSQMGTKIGGTGLQGDAGARQGTSVGLSADGKTAIIGAPYDNNNIGACWIFTRSGNDWVQQGTKLVGTGYAGAPLEGTGVALSADGNTALIGASYEGSFSGATWVFTRNGSTWSQQGPPLKANDATSGAKQGAAVSLSADGNTAFIGGYGDNESTGAAWVYTRANGVWTQRGPKLVGTGGAGIPTHGFSVAISADGSTGISGGPTHGGIMGATWIFVAATLSTNAELTSIKLSPVSALAAASGPGYKNYTTSVPNSQTSLKVIPAAQDVTATIKVNGATVASGAPSPSIPLNVGDNVINVIVTAQDGATTKNYIITAKRAGLPVATLSSLALSAGTLSPVFATATTGYTAVVPNATSSIKITPAATDANAAIKVNGVTVASGASLSFPLVVGTNTITTVVTAQDGTTTKTYTVTVTRAAAGLSTDAKLLTIKPNPKTTLTGVAGPGFGNYITSVPNSESSIILTSTAADATATIKVNGATVASGAASQSIPLKVGDNVITIIVTAQDGATTKIYYITATRADLPVVTLSSLALSAGTLSPGFTPATTTYTAVVPNATSSIKITPAVTEAHATVKVNGATVASGAASANIPLAVGTNVINTVVTAQDGITTKTYTVTVTRAATGLSTEARLLTIKPNPKTTFTAVAGPGFGNYTTAVPNSESSVTLTSTAIDANATIKVNGITAASGAASQSIPLKVGDNFITIIVTAQDGATTKTYYITATRAAGSMVAQYVDGPVDKLKADGIVVHQGVSPNGDGDNDVLTIDGIAAYPDNSLQIMNRSGALVYEAKGYDNTTKVFNGHSGTNGKLLQAGTYFYSLDYKDGAETKHKTGFIVLKY